MASRVATYLLDQEIAAQQPVGLVASDAGLLFAMTLGTLRAGAQAIVLDSALAPASLAQACDDAGAGVVLIDQARREVPLRGRLVPWGAVMDHRGVESPDRKATLRYARPANGPWGAIPSAGRAGLPRTDLSMLMEMLGWALELDIRRTTICYAGCLVSSAAGFLIPATTLLVGGTVVAPRDPGVERYRASCDRHAVQIACLHTDQVQALLRSAPDGAGPGAKAIVIAGPSAPADLERGARALLGAQVVAARGDERDGAPGIQRILLSEIVRHWGRHQPDRLAVVATDRTYTYRQLDLEIQRVANCLAAIGERPHQPIGVVARDPVLCLLYVIGIVQFGGHVILLNPDLPLESLALARKDAGCASVLIEDRLVDTLSSAFAGCTLVGHDQVRSAPSDHRAHADPDPYGVWGVVYSSGTTGTPKGIVHSLLSVAMAYIGWSLELPLTRDSVVFVGRPLFYLAGLEISGATLLVGGTLLVATQYSTAEYRHTCAEWKIDLAFFIPDQVRELVENARSGLRATRGAERILVMGSTLPLPIKLSIPDALGSRVTESWGNSEGLGAITDDASFTLRPRSVGRPFLCDSLTIVGSQGEELPPWELGRVAGSSDAQLREYLHRDDLNASMFQDRRVLSEDLGYCDPEGYFYISGRAAGRFLRKGVPVFTTDIEEKLIDLDGILYIAVVGIPDAVDGHAPAAAVVLCDGASVGEAELLRAANERLPALHRLSRLVIVSSLPRNAAGKVVLDAVRGLFP